MKLETTMAKLSRCRQRFKLLFIGGCKHSNLRNILFLFLVH